MPELASKSGCRAVAIGFDPVFDVSADDVGCVAAEFFLPKGCYATVLLRECMKE
jgi:tRNA(Glu) U13 pseudouridine synthase TruD